MPPWIAVLLWWIAFAGSHLTLSSAPVRQAAVRRIGERGFQGLYSLFAFATFVPLVWTYWHNRHTGPLLWSLRGDPAIHGLAMLLSLIAWTTIVLSFVQPSPTGMVPGAAPRAHGIIRITRHPLFAGLALWALAHLLVNGSLADVMFFGGFAVFTMLGAAHQDARKRAAAGLQPFYGETSLLPFGAVITGRTPLALGEIPITGLLIGVAVAAALYALHGWMFRL